MDKGRKFLSDLKLYSDFLGYNEKKQRYETWEEATQEVFNTHRTKYFEYLRKSPELRGYMNYAEEFYKDKKYLASQRSLQFRGKDMFKHNFKMFNCLVMYADKPSFLGNSFYLMLCGCGVGVNMMIPFINCLPKIQKRNKGTKTFVVSDSIEGWGEAGHVLITSYLSTDPIKGFEEYQGYEIKFDYSKIRKKGEKVGRKYKAPGSEGIKKSFEKIELLLNSYVTPKPKKFKSILAYDIFMHIANAVLSGGIRRAACNIIVSPEDKDLIYAKTGNWREENQQRERSNNSVGLLRNKFSKEKFQHYIELNEGLSDIGFVFMNNIFEIFNPCFEIGFTPLFFNWKDKEIVKRVQKSDISLLKEPESIFKTAIQCCNLVEIDGSKIKNKQQFFDVIKAATITGTLQAGYVSFKNIKDVLKETIAISKYESLLGVSITGWASQPWLFNEELLQEGAKFVIEINEIIASLIGINPSSRSTTVKPSGNSAVILGCSSATGGEHSPKYFRVMQLNKYTETANFLKEKMPFLIEEGVYSETKTDYAVFIPITNPKNTLYKKNLQGVKHLKLIKLVKENWVDYGKVEERCIIPTTSHNVSNTVIIDDYQEIADYVFKYQNSFAAVSFLSIHGDKDWNQSPNTSVLSFEELLEKYGMGAIFASGLIVDGLHYFNNNLWEACDVVLNKNLSIQGTRSQVLLKKYWIDSAKRFARNYFKRDLQQSIYCLKDVHLLHKWEETRRKFKSVDFVEILKEPNYINIDTLGSAACSGVNGEGCEITHI